MRAVRFGEELCFRKVPKSSLMIHLQWSKNQQQVSWSNPCQSHFSKLYLYRYNFTEFIRFRYIFHICSSFFYIFKISRHPCDTSTTTRGGPSQAAHDGRIYFAGVPGPAPPRSEATARSGRTWRAGGWDGLAMEDVQIEGEDVPMMILVDLVGSHIYIYIFFLYIYNT